MRFTHNASLLAEADAGEDFTSDCTNPERRAFYRRLMRVTILHDYCNDQDERCRDFVCAPTSTTQAFMTSLSLLFRDEGDGFSILYNSRLNGSTPPGNEKPQEYLVNYLLRGEALGQDGLWTRLSVAFFLKDSYFFNHTYTGKDSITLNPVTQNFYFTNNTARWKQGTTQPSRARNAGRHPQIALEGGQYVNDRELLPVTQDQKIVTVDPTKPTTFILVKDISGVVVQCLPVWVPAGMPGGNVTCQSVATWVNASADRVALYPQWKASPTDLVRLLPVQVETITAPKSGDPLWHRQQVLYINFYKLPRGRYDIVHYPQRKPEDTTAWLYTFPANSPLCFVDLLLTNPEPDKQQGGLYPVRRANHTAKPPAYMVKPTQYTLRFQARKTYWIYYVIPDLRKEPLYDLRIVTPDSGVEYFGVFEPVMLNDGRPAYRSISKNPLRLFERSPYHFNLKATGDDGLPKTLVYGMPVASDRQIFPGDKNFAIQTDKYSGTVACHATAETTAMKKKKKEVFSNIYVYV